MNSIVIWIYYSSNSILLLSIGLKDTKEVIVMSMIL